MTDLAARSASPTNPMHRARPPAGADGIISGFTPGEPTAWARASWSSSRSASPPSRREILHRVRDTFHELTDIMECHLVAGDFDYLLKARLGPAGEISTSCCAASMPCCRRPPTASNYVVMEMKENLYICPDLLALPRRRGGPLAGDRASVHYCRHEGTRLHAPFRLRPRRHPRGLPARTQHAHPRVCPGWRCSCFWRQPARLLWWALVGLAAGLVLVASDANTAIETWPTTSTRASIRKSAWSGTWRPGAVLVASLVAVLVGLAYLATLLPAWSSNPPPCGRVAPLPKPATKKPLTRAFLLQSRAKSIP